MWLCDYVLDMWRAKFVCVCMTSLFLLVAFGWYCSSFSFGWLDNIISCHTGFLKISNRNRSRIIATTPDPLTLRTIPFHCFVGQRFRQEPSGCSAGMKAGARYIVTTTCWIFIFSIFYIYIICKLYTTYMIFSTWFSTLDLLFSWFSYMT